eukprot:m.313730 g.313730  ORF g.313730 m.313730 type:complete len:65 (+) comp433560_c0_seq1:2-196(+)
MVQCKDRKALPLNYSALSPSLDSPVLLQSAPSSSRATAMGVTHKVKHDEASSPCQSKDRLSDLP